MTDIQNNTRPNVEPRNVSMYPVHWATVDAYAKDAGYGSTSAALRRIVDEWLIFRSEWLALGGLPAAEILNERGADTAAEDGGSSAPSTRAPTHTGILP